MNHSTNSEAFSQLLDDLLWLNGRGRFKDGLQEAVDAIVADYTDKPNRYSDGSPVHCDKYLGHYFIAEDQLELPPHRRGHYHLLSVWDPGCAHQRAECAEGKCDLTLALQYIDEVALDVDPECDAIWIIGCGPGRCRRSEICDLPIEEWGEPHWTRPCEKTTPDEQGWEPKPTWAPIWRHTVGSYDGGACPGDDPAQRTDLRD
ncbi:hypothetical protein O6P37_02105 [Mycobacterium sp. CPCC 205372]|uniref:Uncharacterized protein n=1 Tax=Mycobacterium hippophais TaxID=3016340 RepID=A0ABT4PM60_9MYCO|nr:hypothetical protein [Mycobacterium hippophais]